MPAVLEPISAGYRVGNLAAIPGDADRAGAAARTAPVTRQQLPRDAYRQRHHRAPVHPERPLVRQRT